MKPLSSIMSSRSLSIRTPLPQVAVPSTGVELVPNALALSPRDKLRSSIVSPPQSKANVEFGTSAIFASCSWQVLPGVRTSVAVQCTTFPSKER